MPEQAERYDEAGLEAEDRDEGGAAGGFVAGLVLGAALGAGIALLLAPAAGDRTRKRVGKRLRTLRDEAGSELSSASRRGRRELDRRRREIRSRLQDALEDLL